MCTKVEKVTQYIGKIYPSTGHEDPEGVRDIALLFL